MIHLLTRQTNHNQSLAAIMKRTVQELYVYVIVQQLRCLAWTNQGTTIYDVVMPIRTPCLQWQMATGVFNSSTTYCAPSILMSNVVKKMINYHKGQIQ